jgi:hypothetical protein
VSTQGPMPPQGGPPGGGLGSPKFPRQIPAHWLEAMEPLPSEVLRPFREARDHRRSVSSRAAALDRARHALSVREAHHRQWSVSVDARMTRCGVERVDRTNPLQAAAFLARIDRKALTKRQCLDVAIEVAKLEFARLEMELGHGQAR